MFDKLKKGVTRPFAVFSLLMTLKIYLAWIVIFGFSAQVITPIVASIPSVWVAFCLIELFAKKRKLVYYFIVNIVLTSIYFAAIMYYKYYGVIVNFHALKQANQLLQVKSSVISLMHPYFLLIYTDVVVLGLLLLFHRRSRDWGYSRLNISRKTISVVFALSLFLCLSSIWTNREIVNEIKQAEQMGLVNYELYTVFASMKKEQPEPVDITREEIMQLKGIEPLADEPQYFGAAKNKHIIVIQLESFQNMLLGLSVDGQEITPVLNNLKQESIYFPRIFQQVGQGNTSDAEYMLNTSFYIPPHGAASQTYAGKELPSLPRKLKEIGYQSATFHTNNAVFWNRKDMYESLGFDHYYDEPFFGGEDVILFGSSDEVLYEKTTDELKKLSQNGQKLYVNVISSTSHHPYDLPEEKKRIELPEEYKDTLVGDYLISANYADFALGQFIEQLKEAGLWEDSLLIIYGDHMGLPMYSLTKNEKQLLYNLLGHEYGIRDMLNIPLLITGPGSIEPSVIEHVGGQIDFMPTIANLAGISLDDHIHFGQDMINYEHNLLPMRYYLPSGSFINERILFVPGERFEDGTPSSLNRTEEEIELDQYREDFVNAIELLKQSHNYVESLPLRYSSETE